MSAWEGTRLETILKSARRDMIINTGAWTNMSVEHTARTGADKGYFMIVPEDCCSTMNAEWHNASINFALQNVSVVTNADAVIARARLTRPGASSSSFGPRNRLARFLYPLDRRRRGAAALRLPSTPKGEENRIDPRRRSQSPLRARLPLCAPRRQRRRASPRGSASTG